MDADKAKIKLRNPESSPQKKGITEPVQLSQNEYKKKLADMMGLAKKTLMVQEVKRSDIIEEDSEITKALPLLYRLVNSIVQKIYNL